MGSNVSVRHSHCHCVILGYHRSGALSPSDERKAITCALVLVVGGNGYINDYPMGRFLRDAKLYEIGAGTSEVRRLVIGRAFNAAFK